MHNQPFIHRKVCTDIFLSARKIPSAHDWEGMAMFDVMESCHGHGLEPAKASIHRTDGRLMLK